MKNVLFIAPYFIPRRRVGSLRPFKFAIHLQKYNWKPTILTIATPGGNCTPKEEKLLSGIRVLSVKPPFDRTSKVKKTKPKAESGSNYFGEYIASFIDRYTPADSWIFLFWIKYRNILSQVNELNPDLIWSTGDPWSGHWLAEKISCDTDKPWIADFRDPWTLAQVNLRNRSAFSAQKDRDIEQRVIKNANRLIFTSKATEQLYASNYGLKKEKTDTIYNSFEPALFENEKEHKTIRFDSNFLNLLFFGAFRRLSPADPIADILRYLNENQPETAKKIRVHSFGTIESAQDEQLNKMGVREYFVEHAPVLPEESLSVLNSADILLVSTNRERKNIIPAKLWDYMAAKPPILSIAPNPEIENILKSADAGKQVSVDDIEKAAELLAECVKAKHENRLLPLSLSDQRIKRKEYNAIHTTEILASIFDEVLTHG